MAPTQRHRWLDPAGQPGTDADRRAACGSRVDQARADFEERYPEVRFGPGGGG